MHLQQQQHFTHRERCVLSIHLGYGVLFIPSDYSSFSISTRWSRCRCARKGPRSCRNSKTNETDPSKRGRAVDKRAMLRYIDGGE